MFRVAKPDYIAVSLAFLTAMLFAVPTTAQAESPLTHFSSISMTFSGGGAVNLKDIREQNGTITGLATISYGFSQGWERVSITEDALLGGVWNFSTKSMHISLFFAGTALLKVVAYYGPPFLGKAVTVQNYIAIPKF